MKHSLISMFIRGCGAIICSILLLNCPVSPISTQETNRFLAYIFLLYCIICGVATYYNWQEYIGKSIVTCIISLIMGMSLSIISVFSEHPVCSGGLLLVTIASIAMEYGDLRE